MSRRTIAVLVVIIAAAAAAAWWWRLESAREVAAVAPYRGTAVEIVYATGAVQPVRWAKVTSLVRDRIVEICDCEGREVKKGDVLVRLDDREARAQLGDLRAREEFLRRELSRVTELSARGSATTQALERASMDLRQLEAQIAVQTERISDFTIVSPMDGIVLRRDGEVGEIAEVGQVLVRVGVPKPLEIVAEVNEEDIPRVVLGQTALLRTDAFKERPLEGKVREITPMGDPVAKTFRIRIALPDDTPLKPGMSVEANVVSREKPNALLVPADAVAGSTVYVVVGDVARRREVTAGIRGTRAVEILAGLGESDRVASPAPAGAGTDVRIRVIERQVPAP